MVFIEYLKIKSYDLLYSVSSVLCLKDMVVNEGNYIRSKILLEYIGTS